MTFETVTRAFERQVRISGGREAFRSSSEAVSYEELNQLANRVALRLLERSEQMGERIGIHIAEGASRLAALLGVLKAGKEIGRAHV